jgi:hypothetical protein
MPKSKFVPITELGKMTDDQLREYYQQACQYFNIPPEMNLLEFLWLDSGDSGRKRVLYAKKGATDLLRENLGISITKMTKEFGDGFVMFTVEGQNHKGRTDIAVGVASTKNLIGKALENSLMTAQTRATRRLTLQFAGGGLLDESEIVSGSTTDLSHSSANLSQLAALPTVQPSSEKGKDITQVTEEFAQAMLDNLKASSKTPPPNRENTVENAARIETVEEPKKRKPGAGRKKVVVLDSPEPQTVVEVVAEPVKPAPLPSIEQPTDVFMEVEYVDPDKSRCSECNCSFGVHLNTCSHTPPVVKKDLPTPEQVKDLRVKLFSHYIESVLVKQGGLVPIENIGGAYAQLGIVVSRMFDVKGFGEMSFKEWNDFFEFLDTHIEDEGAVGLVQRITKLVEVK